MMNDKHRVFPWMMKTNTLINTMCGLLILAACNMACSRGEDGLPGNSGNSDAPEADATAPIGFSTDASDTRGTGYGPTVLPEAIGVYASQTHGEFDGSSAMMNFMQNQRVEHDAEKNTWSYKPVKFWPEEPTDKLSFFAYAPYNTAALQYNEKGGYPTLIYEWNSVKTNQMDFLVATPVMNRNSGDIKFNLKHALSKVQLSIKSNEDITVKSLKLTGATSYGLVAFDNTEKGFHWTDFSDTASCEISFSETGIPIPANGEKAVPLTSLFMMPDKGTTKLDINYTYGVGDVARTALDLPDTPATWTAGGIVDYTIGMNIAPDNYNGVEVGDILCVKNGSGYTVKATTLSEEDKAKAIGVVFKVGPGEGDTADNYHFISEIHGYAIALGYVVDEELNDGLKWSTVRTSEYINPYIGTSTSTTDYLGYNNTEIIKSQSNYNSITYPSCYYLESYSSPNGLPGKSSGWYMPSIGQLSTILLDYLETIENSLKITNGAPFIGIKWGTASSTECRYLEYGTEDTDIWGVNNSGREVRETGKNNTNRLRPCITF